MTTLAAILAGVALAAEQAEFDETAVTPGVLGFLVTAAFALAVILLGADLVRRVRRSQYKAQIEEELAAEIAEREAAEGPGSSSASPEEPAAEDRSSEHGDGGDTDPGAPSRA